MVSWSRGLRFGISYLRSGLRLGVGYLLTALRFGVSYLTTAGCHVQCRFNTSSEAMGRYLRRKQRQTLEFGLCIRNRRTQVDKINGLTWSFCF